MRTCARARSGALLLSVLLLVTPLSPLSAASAPFAKVEISAPAAPRGTQLTREFTAVVHREVSALRVPTVRAGSGYVLSVALTRYDVRTTPDEVTTSCGVSLTLRDRRGGSLRAILSGRATTQDWIGRQDEARRLALESAVRSTLNRLPSSLE